MTSLTGPRRLLLAGLAIASALVLTGCNPGSGAVEDFPGLPVAEEEATDEAGGEETNLGGGTEEETDEEDTIEVPEPTGDEPFVQYLDDGGKLAVTIWGSSTCPVVPTEITVLAEAGEGNAVEVKLPEPETGPCTADYVPHTTVFWTPVFTTTTEPLEVTIGDQVVTVPIK
ncbi:hypothetical protein GCM10017608_13910 [Agromyces luteolus]|uniref:Uncharacterized protein n=1 Tax=Agromyces luteolus TaxID=88373 RepID=A0A7C9LF75_9MICO|nr:hypothetical protein [Agromyces luteolus]MUN07690.1 hypothetical protein [Agromyces luteolus]GLK27457.1 hypothetical protein GCM10017608_13910 [Agromyces luteolus]